MRLSEIPFITPIKIQRDGEFRSLGILSHTGEAMLVALYDRAYLAELIDNPSIACVLTTPELGVELPPRLALGVCDDPKTVFYQVHDYLFKHTEFYWKNFETEIASDARIHDKAYVAPRNVRIGSRTIVEPHATILERAIVGSDVVIRAGAVVSGEGFEPKYVAGKHIIVAHAGGVRLCDRVELQSNSYIQRAVFGGYTEVGEDTKIDGAVYIAHNVRIGAHCEIAGGAIITGSATVADDVWIGPGAVISSEVRIGKRAYVSLGAVVTRDIGAGQRVSGNFAIEHSRFIQFVKSIR